MPEFTFIQNRKPWNKSAEWLLIHAKWLAESANNIGIDTIEDIANRLRYDFEIWCEGERKDPKRFSINTWQYSPGEFCCGVNPAGSQYDAAFKIRMKV